MNMQVTPIPTDEESIETVSGLEEPASSHATIPKSLTVESRLNFYKSGPNAMGAMVGLEQQIALSGLEKPLMHLVRLRTSQINGCAYCIDLHTAEAREAGERDRRLATLAVWQEMPFFSDRERAALEWTESVTRVADTHVPDGVWERVKSHFEPTELVDLTLLVNTINSWNRFAVAFRMLPN